MALTLDRVAGDTFLLTQLQSLNAASRAGGIDALRRELAVAHPDLRAMLESDIDHVVLDVGAFARACRIDHVALDLSSHVQTRGHNAGQTSKMCTSLPGSIARSIGQSHASAMMAIVH